MRYYRVRTGYAQLEPGEGFAGDQDLANDSDIWPTSSGQPFVLVTRKPWRPPTDIYETAGDVVVKMEVAGMNEESLEITLQDDLLTIRGRRTDETGRRKIGYHHMGITYGEFASEIKLPGPIDQDQVHAEYTAGFLIVTLPKAAPRPTGSIRIAITE